jgi:hypothetical protein
MTELLTHPNGVVTTTLPTMAAAPRPAARDFSRGSNEPLPFTIDGDVFYAAARLPGDVFAEFVTLYNDRVESEEYQQQHDLLKRALSLALLPESYEQFAKRLNDKVRPIDDNQTADVVMWLLEEYAARPTQPSPDSSDGPASPASGTPSTANTQPVESISLPSQPTDS